MANYIIAVWTGASMGGKEPTTAQKPHFKLIYPLQVWRQNAHVDHALNFVSPFVEKHVAVALSLSQEFRKCRLSNEPGWTTTIAMASGRMKL